MNISQPFIHRPINFTIAANDQIIDAEPFDDAIEPIATAAQSGFATSTRQSPV
jgi:hypothetical protein